MPSDVPDLSSVDGPEYATTREGEPMTTPSILRVTLAAPIVLLMVGCASTPSRPEGSGTLFKAPPDAVKKAAVVGLVTTGFEITKEDAGYVEGFRPRKMGMFVGSGGETAGVWIVPVDSTTSRVHVDTARSFLGVAGQKNWDSEILVELTKVLNMKQLWVSVE